MACTFYYRKCINLWERLLFCQWSIKIKYVKLKMASKIDKSINNEGQSLKKKYHCRQLKDFKVGFN